MPKVSVILTSYNHDKFICEAIDSVLNQSFRDFELIIWDDASSDNSWNLINQYSDSRIKAFRNEEQKRGIWGINKAISEVATGEYIAIHHSDDVWERDKLEKQAAFLEAHSEVGAVFTNALAIGEDNLPLADKNHFYSNIFDQPNRTRHEWLRFFFSRGNALCHPSVLIRKSCYEYCGLYRFGLAQVGDFDMWIRLCLKYEIYVMPEKLVRFRVRSNEANTSGNRPETRIRGDYEFYKLLLSYRTIKKFDELVKVFPGAQKYHRNKETDIDFALAMIALEEKPFIFTQLFGLDILFEAIVDPKRSAKIKRLYDFDYKSFISLTAQHDVLSREAKENLLRTLTERDGQIVYLNQAVAERNVQIVELKQTIAVRDKQIDSLKAELSTAADSLSNAEERITAMINSRSWRITAGFRRIASKARSFAPRRMLRVLATSHNTSAFVRNLPISPKIKLAMKEAAFLHTGSLFRHLPAYQTWREFRGINQEGNTRLDLKRSDAVFTPDLDDQPLVISQSGKKKILVIDATTPTPDRDAGSVTAFFFMKAFIELGFDVTFIPDDLKQLGHYTENLRALGVRCLTRQYINSIEDFMIREGRNLDVVILYRVHTARLHMPTVKKYAPSAKIVFDTVDMHHLREERQAMLDNSPESIERARFTKQAEFRMMRSADATIVLSSAELEHVRQYDPSINVFTIPLLLDVPGCRAPYAARRDIIFIGGFLHQPNVDAIKYFVNEIWPIVREKLPDAKLFVIGSIPPDEVLALGGEDDRIRIIGFVEDLDPYFDACRISIAPLRFGAGIKGKIGTSASYGVPCVATTLAVEGMGLSEGVDVLVADEAEIFAEKLVQLYSDEKLWNQLSGSSLEFVQRNYSYKIGRARLRRLLNSFDNGLLANEIIDIAEVESLAEFKKYRQWRQDEYARRAALERASVGDVRGFTLEGYCAVCHKASSFHSDFEYAFTDAEGKKYPNWRERLVCASCKLNNRVRASIHIFRQECAPPKDADIYVTEQTTVLHAWMKSHYSSIVGSEFLGPEHQHGEIISDGIRHESLTRLSFDEDSFDYVLSFDVLEHIPDYQAAIHEYLRVLRPGGQILFSVPFCFDSNEHIVRARIRDDGAVEHLLEPEYHGDPLNAAGCLCFYQFGWRLLEEFREAGFYSVKALFYWSAKFGYLGLDHALFLAAKRR